MSAMCVAGCTKQTNVQLSTHNIHSVPPTHRITVSNLILEYILSNAAAVRGFAPYLALLCNQDSSYFLINWNIGPGYILDFW